jgi:hypothetical protein
VISAPIFAHDADNAFYKQSLLQIFVFVISLPVHTTNVHVTSGPVIAENLKPMAHITQLPFSYFHGRVIILLEGTGFI